MPYDFGGTAGFGGFGGGMSRHFAPQIPSWLHGRMPWGQAQPQPPGWMGAPRAGQDTTGMTGGGFQPGGQPTTTPAPPGVGLGQFAGMGGGSAAAQTTPGGTTNPGWYPYVPPGYNLTSKGTPQDIGLLSLYGAYNAGAFRPGYDPLSDMIRQQAFQDNAGRQNAGQLTANLQGGGDPYLRGYASLQSQMGGQSDLARLLGESQLSRGQGQEDFYRQLLMTMLGGSYQQMGKPKNNTGIGDIGAALGGLGALIGASRGGKR